MAGDRLKQYIGRLLAVEPPYIDIFGNTPPGMGSASTSGAANAGTDTVNRMRQEAVDFARGYVNARVDKAGLRLKAETVEASLLACVTLGVLSEAEADDLTDELHDLLAVR